MVMIQSCCWWNNVLYGSYGSAGYSVVVGGIFTCLVMFDVRPFSFFGNPDKGPALGMGGYLQIICGLSLCLAACSLALGVYRRTQQLIIPWMVSMLLFTVVLIMGNVHLWLLKEDLQEQSGADSLVIAVSAVLCVLNMYGGLCVFSLYQVLSEETSKHSDHGISFILPEKASIRYFKRSNYDTADSWSVRGSVSGDPRATPTPPSHSQSVKSGTSTKAAPPTVTIQRENQLRSSLKQTNPNESFIQTYIVPRSKTPTRLTVNGKSAAAKQVRIQAPDRLQKG